MAKFTTKCPPGVFCMTPTFIVVCVAILGICSYLWYIYQPQKQLPPIQFQMPQQQVIQVEQDDRYMRAPKPERHWITRPDIPNAEEIYGKLPRIPTRGIPETYQSMGIIKTDDGQILPLYGRRTTARSDRFQYYTRTDTYNPVQLPIRYNRRDCQDDIGCEELGDRDVVTITPTNQRGTATIYRFDGPTYVPGIL